MISDVEIAWLAGILEGEGYFALPGPGNPYPAIVLSMSDRDIVERCAAMFGARAGSSTVQVEETATEAE